MPSDLIHHPRTFEPARVDELAALLRARTPGEGRMASVLPGLWFFRFDRPEPAQRHRSSTMYLGVAIQGQKTLRVGGRTLIYDRLNYLVLRGETEYEAAPTQASPDAPYLALGLQLPPELVVRTLLELSEAAPGSDRPARGPEPVPAFVSTLEPELIDALCRLLRSVDDPAERRLLAPLALREIVFRLLRSEAAGVLRQAVNQGGDRFRIERAMAFIDGHYERSLSVSALARRFAMSPSHFAHRFREIASVSPMRYLKHVRMSRARELLLGGDLASVAVAERVGYASVSHFSRDFKRHFGLAPGQYARAFERASAVPSIPEPAIGG